MNRERWREFWRAHRADTYAISLLALYFIIFFGPMILRGRFFLFFDSYIELYPERMTAWSMIRQGTLPLWTPLLLSGYPLLSMAQIGLAYPLTWGYLFLPGHWAEEIFVLAPYLLCPIFTYAFARQLKRSRLASLLAALAYGYGGLMIIGYTHNGLLPNSTMWTPLVLLVIDRSQTESFTRSWLWATVAYSMSVFTGIGQGFLFVGLMASAYALFLVLFQPVPNGETIQVRKGWLTLIRWRPVLVTVAAIVTSASLNAFEILETFRAQRRSIRSSLSFEIFAQHSFTPLTFLKSVLAPIYITNTDLATGYVPLVALLLAICAVVATVRNKQRDTRVFFWLAVALTGGVLMLGVNTPVYPMLYYVPVINKFRGAARHGYEWTFAVAILSAYGWDAVVAKFSGARDRLKQTTGREILLAVAPLALSLLIGLVWWRVTGPIKGTNLDIDLAISIALSIYLRWKLLFTLPLLFALWRVLKWPQTRMGLSLAAVLIALSCFSDPFIMVSRWWWPQTKTASRITTPTLPTRMLQQFPPEQNRIYTRVHLDAEEYNPQPLFDSQNLTMLYGLQNVAGYEPLMLERYSRALGNAWLDGVGTRGEFNPDPTLFQSSSHVLDLLNTTYTLTYSNPLEVPDHRIEREGIKFARYYDSFTLEHGESSNLMATFPASGDTLAIVSTLSYGASAGQGLTVGRVRIIMTDGEVIEREIRAGLDTAEWAHERPDVLPIVRHQLATIFDQPGKSNEPFPSYRYWIRIPLGKRVDVERVEISNVAPGNMALVIWNTILYDSANSHSQILQLSVFDKNKWRPIYNENNVLILHNERAMPRAWLVGEAVAVDEEEALARIRGESQQSFDPAQTALLEVAPENLPALPGGTISPDASAKIVSYEPNRLAIETSAGTASVLVLSEINYPGWEATVDGQKAQIYSTNYLLRGVVLPKGSHRVEMRYTAPAARNGAIISTMTLLLMCGLAFYVRRESARSRFK
ncbi:MAG TPA: YfhO family protein [Pyrinomonadaceae bacterium]|nr:YfhO family protein [Pyrinomonadaceae bacterium]